MNSSRQMWRKWWWATGPFSDNPENHQLALDRLVTASKAAGFKEIDFVRANCCRLQVSSPDRENLVLVADFGGVPDFTIIKMDKDRFQAEDVLALGGVSIGEINSILISWEKRSVLLGSKITYKRPMGSNKLSQGSHSEMCSPADIVFLNNNSIKEFIRDATLHHGPQRGNFWKDWSWWLKTSWLCNFQRDWKDQGYAIWLRRFNFTLTIPVGIKDVLATDFREASERHTTKS